MEYIAERITIDDNICNGRPTVRGTRITVQTVLEFLSAGDSAEDILLNIHLLNLVILMLVSNLQLI
jgi:uncharacterized protein (DUF433 family)